MVYNKGMIPLHDLHIQEVKAVIGRYGDVDEVNTWLKEGWILLGIYMEAFLFDEVHKVFSHRPCFVLGRAAPPDRAPPRRRQAKAEEPAKPPATGLEDDELGLAPDTIIRLTSKGPGLKLFGEDFDSEETL